MKHLIASFLNISQPPQKVDTIFVLAGRENRKAYGIKLWKQGFASELILSVDRFEWRRFYDLGLASDGGLRQLVESTPPEKRHFFVRFRGHEAEAHLIFKLRYGTLSEAQALGNLLRASAPTSLMVISNPAHLRRAGVAFRHSFRGLTTKLIFVATPADKAPGSAVAIWTEFAKYLFYRSSLHAWF
jgi:uncharacterized SAM-binding protein YcdF (DUF218 family)